MQVDQRLNHRHGHFNGRDNLARFQASPVAALAR